jgi:hypothetical protein
MLEVPYRLAGRHGVVLLLAVLAQTLADTPEVSMMQQDDIMESFDRTTANIERQAGMTEEDMLGESAEPSLVDVLTKAKAKKEPFSPIIPRSAKMFSRIPNMVFPGVVENVKNKDECMDHCIKRSQCRSYSYKQKGNKCFWATGSLRYSHQWEFYTKEFDTNAFGKLEQTNEFFKFAGLFSIDQDGNMQTHRDQSVDDCKERCNSDAKCMSFSYHALDKACLMGRAKVHYSKGWNYYERNQRPAKKGQPWLPYPFELDGYQRKLKKEEEDSMRMLLEQERKKRVSREKKEGVTKHTMKHMEKKKKRLDKEMQMKAYAREQSRKKMAAIKKKRKADASAATEKGKFDEAFHKQEKQNAELLRQRRKEKSVKLNFMAQLNEKNEKQDAKMEAHLAKQKLRERNKMLEAQRVIKAKEKKQKESVSVRAAQMKVTAFKLVKKERKFKSSIQHDVRVAKSKKIEDAEKRKQWDRQDDKAVIENEEKNVKRKMKNAKDAQALKLKLAKEKAGKTPSKADLPGEKTKTKSPKKPKAPKQKRLPKSAPGTTKPKMDSPKSRGARGASK